MTALGRRRARTGYISGALLGPSTNGSTNGGGHLAYVTIQVYRLAGRPQ
ncbi:hypothetical protein [Actinopolymorpha pittospori]|uniref:Uncharacterized protein n=1 Tax=Actinopolymorpha pittospori TaxID=648752 RepID=A0A927MRG9_9ACTN|nr:hypothetical protein [Actinopolymorpha pittospori]MBE1603878.1 hypothetical protein [Actinopolymorpha pittospori]